MVPPWVIIGCGYTGTRLARVVVGTGADVTVTRRDGAAADAKAAELGARGARADFDDPPSWRGLVRDGAVVACLAPPGRDPAAGMRSLIAAAERASRFIYVSSTGVYAPGGGQWVDEQWQIAPATPSGRARVACETVVAEAALSTVILRAAGIYGPGRGLAERIAAGSYRIVGDGRSHVSRIHVDDLVEAMIRAATASVTGAINIADDDPAPIGEVADAIATSLGRPPPPRVAPDTVAPEIAGMLTADRKIANQRMKQALGLRLRYPSWRSALAR
ncbi:MAG: NAD-dependent epimerase/dehydratase family protein [Kofleriaceae bacterium]